MSLDDALKKYPVQMDIPVQWGEMDSFGHVNNIIYFRYFESARIDYFMKMGIVGEGADEIGPILASTTCKFIFPLTHPDTAIAAARVAEVQEDRFIMEYAVFSTNHQRIAAKGTGVIIPYHYRLKEKADLPRSWRAAIAYIG